MFSMLRYLSNSQRPLFTSRKAQHEHRQLMDWLSGQPAGGDTDPDVIQVTEEVAEVRITEDWKASSLIICSFDENFQVLCQL